MIEFRVSDLRADRREFSSDGEVLVGVTGDFEIVAETRLVCREVDFPVVELAAEMLDWLCGGMAKGLDFEFDSMSTPEPGWVWFRGLTSGGWSVGALHQDWADTTVRSTQELRIAVVQLAASIQAAASRYMSLDLSGILGETQ